MSNKVAAALGPNVDTVRADLKRRRELSAMTKVELINEIMQRENDLAELGRSIEHAYGFEP